MSTTRGAHQRASFLAGAVDHVLGHGVTALSLRPLAAALGTSDRMLLYYFGTRERLLDAVLTAVGEQLRAGLEVALPADPMPPAVLLRSAWGVVSRPDNEAHLRLYVEISGLAARGQEPFRTTAAAVARDWLDWTAARLAVPADERHRAAAGVLAVLDGRLLTRFVTGEETAQEAAMWLGVALGATSARHS